MTDLMERPVEEVAITKRKVLYRHPQNVTWAHLHRLFRRHPNLRNARAARLAEALHDGPVMGA